MPEEEKAGLIRKLSDVYNEQNMDSYKYTSSQGVETE